MSAGLRRLCVRHSEARHSPIYRLLPSVFPYSLYPDTCHPSPS